MDGILLFNKPILWTSHDAVDFIRRRLGQKAVGHAGTLDPLASGLLVMLLGKSTKRSQEFSALDKDYYGTMTLGVRTDTQDLEGRVVASADCEGVRQEEVERVFLALSGRQSQTPPAFSAARKGGRKLYDWTRRGVVVEAQPKEITVTRFTLTHFAPPDIHFSLTCSKGTYVRTLCDEVGQRLGCGAALSALSRTRVGSFSLDQAMSEAEVRESAFSDIEKRILK
jgi:tRNA pseudouridine55 synthase